MKMLKNDTKEITVGNNKYVMTALEICRDDVIFDAVVCAAGDMIRVGYKLPLTISMSSAITPYHFRVEEAKDSMWEVRYQKTETRIEYVKAPSAEEARAAVANKHDVAISKTYAVKDI